VRARHLDSHRWVRAPPCGRPSCHTPARRRCRADLHSISRTSRRFEYDEIGSNRTDKRPMRSILGIRSDIHQRIPRTVRTLVFGVRTYCGCVIVDRGGDGAPTDHFRSNNPLESDSDMPEAFEESNPTPSAASPAPMTADAFSRRTLMASVIGGVSAVALAGRVAGALRGPSKPQLAQTGSTGQSAIGAATPSPLVASPAA
jgi:hypothetical protein